MLQRMPPTTSVFQRVSQPSEPPAAYEGSSCTPTALAFSPVACEPPAPGDRAPGPARQQRRELRPPQARDGAARRIDEAVELELEAGGLGTLRRGKRRPQHQGDQKARAHAEVSGEGPAA